MTTVLTLSTGTDGPAPQRVAPISGATPAQSRVRQNLGGLTQAYRALSMTQKGGWQAVANTLNNNQNRAGRHKISAANAFVTLNSALLSCGQAILNTAPTNLNAPPVLPSVLVMTSSTGEANSVFSLKLGSIGYAYSVSILAAPPAPAGKNTFPDNSFKTIGALAALPIGAPVDITTMYTIAFGTPPAGSQIALKLIGTSLAGVRLSPLVITGVVTGASADTDATPRKRSLHIA